MPHCFPRSLLVATFLALVLPAQDEAEATDPAFVRIRTMLKEATAAQSANENDDARRLVREALAACLALPERSERKDAHDLLFEVGYVAYLVADRKTAHEAWQNVREYRVRTLPDDHPDLQAARNNLAAIKSSLGDLEGARALREKVYEVFRRTLPDDHPSLQTARSGLAITKYDLGDLAGARALQEKVYEVQTRTLPDDHSALQMARTNLSNTMSAQGDMAGARALREKVYEVYRRTLPDDHPDLQRARNNLANSKWALGDRIGARALREKVYAVRRDALPDGHPALQSARLNLAVTRLDFGDLAGAHALFEKVHEVWHRTLPDDHPDLQMARGNLANTTRHLGDLGGAHALFAKIYEVFRRTLPDDHAKLQRARHNLAMTMSELGDLAGARALQEKVYEIQSRELTNEHPDLQLARHNLANTLHALGDLAGARVLREKVYAVRRDALPDGHPALQSARTTLANTREALGDLAGGRALREKVYEISSRTLPDDHPDLQVARTNLALTKSALGDFAGALSLQEKVYETFRRRALPDDHPELQRARLNLAATRSALGDLVGARTLQEQVYAGQSRALPGDHPSLQLARGQLTWSWAHAGRAGDAVKLGRERSGAARRRLSGWALAPRELGAMARQERPVLDQLLTLVGGFGSVTAQPELAVDALVLAQTLRGVQTRAARTRRAAGSADPERFSQLKAALRVAAAKVSRVAGEAVEGAGEELEARWLARNERLAAAVHAKERIERELAGLAAKAGRVATADLGAAELAAALPERSAAAAIVTFTHHAPDPGHPGRTIAEARLAALVLDREASVEFVALGATADVELLVETLHSAQPAQAGRGRQPEASPSSRTDETRATAERLHQRVLAPVLAACGPIDTLYLAVDELFELVPLDALPLDDDHLVGERVVLHSVVSLFDLLEPQGASPGEAPELLIAGGIDYGRIAEEGAPLNPVHAASPVLERAGEAGPWAALPGTAREASEIAALFAQAFSGGKAERFARDHSAKSQIAPAAARATFVHMATHGYFAPEDVSSVVDGGPVRADNTIDGLSPLVLCGLALSGANLPPDDLGRRAGILTAEEILSLDLSRCYLVTLSACDTSLGVRRAGQGYASLRAALQGAGARFVVTSLWKVGDNATMQLMIDFYRRLWVQKKNPHQALWEAKMAARKQGAPFRDWAGWVLTGN